MEIIIQDDKKNKRNSKPRYVVNISFMHGDADAYEHETVEFEAEDDRQLKNLYRLILALEGCNAAYPHGRGGYDDYDGLPEFDAFFNDGHDEAGDLLNPDGLFIQHPSMEGIQSSFDGYTVTFIDAEGNTFPTECVFTDEEKQRFEECKKFFK